MQAGQPIWQPSSENAVTLSLLVATDEQGVIGKDNRLPWHLPNDLKYFKNLTWGMPIIMGRKTYESIGKPLPGRKSIVVTRNTAWKAAGVEVVHGIEEAVAAAERYGVKEVFVIGGAGIFETAMGAARRLYRTLIHHRFEGDVFFPQSQFSSWQKTSSHYHAPDEKNQYAHTFEVWERRDI